jgi:3-phenylpropionate/cinnamic acid dioxygenase small subunit
VDAYTAISQLIYTYAERIDAGDFEGLAELFAHGRVTGGGTGTVRKGRDEVLRMYQRTARIYEDTGTPKTKHVTTNLIIEVDDQAGTAQARSYFTVLQGTPDLPLQPVISGRYHDRFERAGSTWRFTERHFLPDLLGDLSHHLL